MSVPAADPVAPSESSPQPTADAYAQVPSFEEAWPETPVVLNEDTDDDDALPIGDATPTKPASDGVSAGDTPKPLSRREQERAEHQSAIAAERTRAETIQSQYDELQSAQQVAARAALDALGVSGGEFDRLQNLRLRREPMSFDDDETLDTMLKLREHSDALSALWSKTYREHYATEAKAYAEKHGLDPKVIDGNTGLASIIEHAVTATETRIRQEQSDENTRLRAALKGAEAKAIGATARQPMQGGRSADSLREGSSFDPSKSARQNAELAWGS